MVDRSYVTEFIAVRILAIMTIYRQLTILFVE